MICTRDSSLSDYKVQQFMMNLENIATVLENFLRKVTIVKKSVSRSQQSIIFVAFGKSLNFSDFSLLFCKK